MRIFSVLIVLMLSYSVFYAQKPVIFWASDPVKPNETILVQGDLLDGNTELEIAKLDNKPQKGHPKMVPVDFTQLKWTKLRSMQSAVQTGKYIVPSDWKVGIYAIRPVKNDLQGTTRLVNAPSVWWIQGDQVTYSTPNQQFSVFGNCLSFGNAKVYLKNTVGEFISPEILEQDMWHISLGLKDISVGKYQVYVHNGLGGNCGWISAGELVVKNRNIWSQKVFNVVDYGAKPNSNPSRSRLDQTNDSPAFQRALDAAGKNGGGIVFVPRGCYRLVEEIDVPRYVTIRGESQLSTNLGWTDKNNPPLGLINGTNNFAVEDLSIFVQNYWSVIRGDHGHVENSGNISVKRVTIRANRNLGITNRDYPNNWKEMQTERTWNIKRREAALFFGGENIEVRDCDVIASHNSIILDNASGVLINNKLYCPITFQNSQYWIRGCHDLIVTDNDIYGGGCMGTHNTTRGINGQKDWEVYLNSVSRNIYFADNYQHDNWKWDREMMTLDSHGYNGPYVGPVEKAVGNKVILPASFPVLSVAGEINRISGGAIFSQKVLKPGAYYKILVKMQSKENSKDWDRCFINFYEDNEALENTEPVRMQRNGDARNYVHGKANKIRIRGSKDFEVKELRLAKSWTKLLDATSNKPLLTKTILNGRDVPQKETGVLFDFDSNDILYALATVKANGPHCTGQVEWLMENGKPALAIGISRLGGVRVDFPNSPNSQNQNSGNINLYKGAFVYVLEGKGCGQYRKIMDGNDRTLVLDRPWDVELDRTSVISIHRALDHQIFVHNNFEDGGDAMLLYSGAVENIVANNSSTRTSGFVVTGLQACVPMYCQFLNNTVVTGAGLGGHPFNLRGGRISVEPYRPVGYLNGYQAIGIVMRGNKFENMASATVSGPVQNVLIENNFFANTETAILVNSVGMGAFENGWFWPQDVFIRNNKMKNVDSLLKSDKEASVKVCK